MDEDPFDDLGELSEDDFRVLNAATQFMCLSSGIMNESNLMMEDTAEAQIVALKEQLARANQRADQLERNMVQLQQERYTKEGEAAILRERLIKIEKERTEMLSRSTERLQQSEQSRQSIESEYRRSIDALKSEIAFKDHEIEGLAHRLDHVKISGKTSGTKERRVESKLKDDIPEGFEHLTIKRPAPYPADEVLMEDKQLSKDNAAPVQIEHAPYKPSPREILDEAFECVEFMRDISKLLDYDYEEILKRKDLMHRCLQETGSLLASIEISYDSALSWLRQSIFIYFARIVGAVFALHPELAKDALGRVEYPVQVTRSYPEYASCQLIPKLCQFLSSPPFGMHPWVFSAHMDVFKSCLVFAGHSVPLEIKDLIEVSEVLPRCLVNFLENDTILLDYVQLMALMSPDRTAMALLLRANSTPVEASMMALIIKVGMNRFKRPKHKFDPLLLALAEFMLLIGRKAMVPLHVAFDRRYLREMIRFLGEQIWLKKLDLKMVDDYAIFIECLHFVFVEKQQSLRGTLKGAFFSLNYIAEKILSNVEVGHRTHQFASQLYSITNAAGEDWLRELEASKRPRAEQDKIDLPL